MSSPQDRPTLPSVREMLPDHQFELARQGSSDILQGGPACRVPPPLRVPPALSRGGTRHSRSMSSPQAAHPLSPPPLTAACSLGPQYRASPAGSSEAPRVRTSISQSPRQESSSLVAGDVFQPHLRDITSHPFPYDSTGTRGTPSQRALRGYSFYIVPADECPPGDDRRHGCGICHRRFNRPSSLLIHMNSHTGAQPFECPFPGCTRRFSVNSNMRRHYRNHREGALAGSAAQTNPSPRMQYRNPYPPPPYHAPSASPSASSAYSSFTEGSDDHPDTVTAHLDVPRSPTLSCASPPSRTRSHSDTHPALRVAPAVEPRRRSCTVPGCDCDETPGTLRPAAFHEGSASITGFARRR
ncbi:uncharacterized protein BXZ73DRAFT_108071 [Epithele typhae]|uniref:uncharacterized protein n=1 Tax=Epithele typhae TaxID=378194 RepID=UPI002008B3C0|nr:uncharacterized protein BXZ73DRAFT_108071 [Epithele typhae]KAH9911336.1 hypothetical protein BXZ73DRAFT_108071 [Epithele typhae]